MRFHADLHVHSKFSRATSRDLDLEHLAAWACRKGISVVGTGDFTHPAWQGELKTKLVPAEPGLFRLRDDVAEAVARTLPAACRTQVRFILEVEISTIYKKGDRTRKIHHLIYAPDLAAVDRMSARLARIGNIASDGRPILGLDSRDLLEITLEADPHAYLVPAHIWTPWFAALGSQSGFDTIADCYGDLADHIFAVETGLSSDPPMNWRVSFLDRYRLTSNSDAHSPGKLGREATTFDCELDYFAIKHALETGHGYAGTVEFFPEEGKYHLDGHRKCETPLTPKETLAHGGRCPVCGNPVTIGVEHRVETLADRDQAVRPATAGAVTNLVPLPEILSELTASGPATQTVARGYDQAIARLGPELGILQSVPTEDIAHAGSPLLADAITRLRAGSVIRQAGYDGEYGVIRLFEEGELKRLTRGGLLFDAPPAAPSKPRRMPASGSATTPAPAVAPRPALTLERLARSSAVSWTGRRNESAPDSIVVAFPDGKPVSTFPGNAPAHDRASSPTAGILAALDDQQRAAAAAVDGAVLIIAGPGSGKTRTLTHRIAHMIAERGAAPASCLAITFTRRAAAEMRERLVRLLPGHAEAIPIHTFHSLGLAILREHPEAGGLQRGFRIAGEAERATLLATTLGVDATKAERMLRAISKAKRRQSAPSEDLAEAIAAYDRALALNNCVDFDDLVARAVRALMEHHDLAAEYRRRFRFINVDEFQDVDGQQYQLLTLIAPTGSNLCIIGDPNQAIYGFRGADASCFERFHRDHPDARSITLRRNYRSTGTIVAASGRIVAAGQDLPIADIVREMHERITLQAAPTDRAEAEAVVKTIEEAIGGHTFFSIDSGRAADAGARSLSFGDFAVLYRTDAQAAVLREALDRSGIPYQKGSHGPLAEEPAVQALLKEVTAAANDTQLTELLQQAVARCAEGGTSVASLEQANQRLKAIAASCNGDRARFLDAVALASETDLLDPRADRVSLLTLHGAKGLEFPVVIITGLEDGIVPLSFGQAADDATIAGERRLLYVGMTRAMDRLILSHARQRLWRGRVRNQSPSPFLRDIEEALLQQRRALPARAKLQDRQLSLF